VWSVSKQTRQAAKLPLASSVSQCCWPHSGCAPLCAPSQAVRAIGRCAVMLERAAEKCINVLLQLIQTKVNYVVQEAIVVIKVRRAPARPPARQAGLRSAHWLHCAGRA